MAREEAHLGAEVTAPSLIAYRTTHRIQVDDSGPLPVCAVDGLRIHPTRVGGWFHDASTVRRLHREDIRAMVERPYVSEMRDDGLGQAKARDELLAGTAYFEEPER